MKRLLTLLLLCAMPVYGQASRNFEESEEDHIETPDVDTTGDITLTMWVEFESHFDNDSFWSNVDGTSTYTWVARLFGTDEWEFGINNGGFLWWQTTGGSILNGQWYHLVITYDGSSNPNLYVDGSLMSWGTTATPAAMLNHDDGTDIGTIDGTGQSGYHDGLMAYTYAYDRILTEWERAQSRYCANPLADALVALPLWGSLEDLSGNGKDGTNQGTVTSDDGPPVSWCG
jgi:hypothetical protein